jgi:hypothetical protein
MQCVGGVWLYLCLYKRQPTQFLINWLGSNWNMWRLALAVTCNVLGLFGFICVPTKGNLLNSQSIGLVQFGIDRLPVPQAVRCNQCELFGFICVFIKGNLLNPLSIDLVQTGICGDWLGQSHTMCWRLFGFICVAIKGNLLNSLSIDLVQTGICGDWLGQSHAMCWGLFGFICIHNR